MEIITSPNYLWDDFHHRSYYLPQETTLSLSSHQFTIEAKEFIPYGLIDWLHNQIPTLYVFEEGNITNISTTSRLIFHSYQESSQISMWGHRALPPG